MRSWPTDVVSIARSFLVALLVSATIALSQGAVAAFEFTKVVDTSTPVPGQDGIFFQFNSSDTPAVSGQRVVFGTADQVIWTAFLNGRRLRRVITPNANIPGGFGKFKQFFGNYVTILGTTVVLVGDNCGGCGSGVGLYTRSVDGGPITTLVDINQFLPGSTTEKFGGFDPDFHVDGNHVVFENRQQVFAVPLAGGPVNGVAGPQHVDFSPPSPFCCIFVQPTLYDADKDVFLLAGNVFGRHQLQSVKRSGNPLSFRVIADGNMHPPKTPADYRFDNFEFLFPILDETPEHQYFIFRAASTNGVGGPYIQGIYNRGSAGFKRLVDTTLNVPGGTGQFQINPGFDQIAAKNGIVVFRGTDAAGNPGLYAVRAEGGPISKIIAKGDPINSFTVDNLLMRRDSFDGTTLAFLVSYAGFLGTGIYTTQITLP